MRSVISHPGVRYVALLEGVNDVGHADTSLAAQDAVYNQIVKAMEEIVAEVHAAGLPIFGGTLPPSFAEKSNFSSPQRAATRDRLNHWIKNKANFDYLVDYAAVLSKLDNPDQYQAQYAYTDDIHPNVAGHRAMADAWDLGVFQKFAHGN